MRFGPTENKILKSLSQVKMPGQDQDIVSLKMVSGIQIERGHVTFCIEVDPQQGTILEPLRLQAVQVVEKLWGVKKVTAVLTAEKNSSSDFPDSHAPTLSPKINPTANLNKLTPEQRPFAPEVKHIIAVGSGKGGVGKSTVSVNVASALKQLGLSVGILDADIYGPSLPHLLGQKGEPEIDEDRFIQPIEVAGLKTMSIGYLIDEDRPVIWRGPMIQSALYQMLRDVDWGALDVLVIDLPPGTGDIQLSLAQKVPLTGAVIVSTPQDLALLDARKALVMFKKLKVPILGIVENMSLYICPSCGHEDHIFGHEGAKKVSEALKVEYLGGIPLDKDIRQLSDQGMIVVDNKNVDQKIRQSFLSIAENLLEKLKN